MVGVFAPACVRSMATDFDLAGCDSDCFAPLLRDAVSKPTFPKSEVVESILDHTSWPGLPRLTALADVPVITAETGLLTKPGYDPDSGVYLLPGGYADVPSVPPEPMPHVAKTDIGDRWAQPANRASYS